MTTFKGEKSPCCGALVHWEVADDGGYENPWCDDCAGDVPTDVPLRPVRGKKGGAP